MKRPICLIVLVAVVNAAVYADSLAQAATLDQRESKIRELIRERVERHHHEFGLIVGIISTEGRKIIRYGKQSQGGEAVNEDTLFELGSVTKVFTALLLADMVKRGEMKYSDPVEKFLPDEVKVPCWNGNKMSLFHLATHTSGLPSTPRTKTEDRSLPAYLNFTQDDLYNFLSHYELSAQPGTQFEYSNLGFGLLGHIISLKSGKSFDQLVEERICRPLGLDNTHRELESALRGRLAVGYFLDGQKAKDIHMPPVLAGAGGLRSSAGDMLTFLAVNLGLESSALFDAMQETHQGRFPVSKNALKVGLSWLVAQGEDLHLVFHGGEKDGYRAFIGFDPENKIGAVVFSNFEDTIDDVGLYALTGKQEILELVVYKENIKEGQINPRVYDEYTGKYQTTPSFFISVTREGDRLFAQGTGQPKFELFPESESTFFLKAVRAKVIFERDSSGRVCRLIVRSAEGKEISQKIEGGL